jgi:hypothetical protein
MDKQPVLSPRTQARSNNENAPFKNKALQQFAGVQKKVSKGAKQERDAWIGERDQLYGLLNAAMKNNSEVKALIAEQPEKEKAYQLEVRRLKEELERQQEGEKQRQTETSVRYEGQFRQFVGQKKMEFQGLMTQREEEHLMELELHRSEASLALKNVMEAKNREHGATVEVMKTKMLEKEEKHAEATQQLQDAAMAMAAMEKVITVSEEATTQFRLKEAAHQETLLAMEAEHARVVEEKGAEHLQVLEAKEAEHEIVATQVRNAFTYADSLSTNYKQSTHPNS